MTGWSKLAAPRFDVRWDAPYEKSRAKLESAEQLIASDICRAMADFGFDGNCGRVPAGHPDLGKLILRQQGRIVVFFEEKVFLGGDGVEMLGYLAIRVARFVKQPATGDYKMELL